MFNGDIDFMTLDEINAEISAITKEPVGKRTVRTADRLRELEFAQRRIRNSNSRRGCW